MRRSSLLFSHFVFLFTLMVSVCQAANYREGYLLVNFNEAGTTAASATARQAVVDAAGGGTIEKMFSIVPGLGVVKLPAGVNAATAQSCFSVTSGVKYAEYDYIQKVQAIPNDARFNELWGMNNTGQSGGVADADIDAPEAWDLATGSKSIIVAVIDTGVDYLHPDLAANMWVNATEIPGNGLDDDNNGFIDDVYGYDFANLDGDPMDDHGHGTHCSGTIGGIGNNGAGVAGVCWNVKIMALKFLTASNGGTTSAAISCIEYAIKMKATLTSNSWGGGGYSQALYDVIAASGVSGQLFVAAAGNSATDNDTIPHYPASFDCDNILAVMSTDSKDAVSVFSCYGFASVDMAAPGTNILSAAPGGGYQSMSGTSMAAPHVAGAAALALSVKPDLSVAELKQVLMSSTDKKPALEGKCISGGRLNVHEALLMLQGGDNLPPLPDPAEWLIKPTATGLTTIVMQAVTAKDKSGVEYRFDCIENDFYDRGWQSSSLYLRSDYLQGTTYSFRVQARDKSVNLNQTQWSEETISTTTATGSDTLRPAPNATLWKANPRVTRPSLNEIGMEVVTSYDENGVEYFFDCVLASDGVDPNTYDSGWQTSPIYNKRVSQVKGHEYEFRAYVRQKGTVDPKFVTDPAPLMKAGKAFSSLNRQVPSAAYRTIQDAINAANNGDNVIILPGVYREINIDFKGKAITVRSINPQDPAIVASTVIDCAEVQPLWAHETRRAFIFRTMEGRNSVLAGLTIRNATAIDESSSVGTYGSFGDPDRGNRYTGSEMYDGRDARGGAILIGQYDVQWVMNFDPSVPKITYTQQVSKAPSSPTIRNCVFEKCSANGKYGDLTSNAPDAPNDHPGNHGSRGLNGGNAYGGAIFAVSGSAPLIKECRFLTCQAVGGNGSNGSNGSAGGGHSDAVEEANGWRGGDGGDGGLGGCAWGGAVYFEPNCLPELSLVTVTDCLVKIGQPGRGGNGGNGSGAKKTGRGGHGGNGGLGGDLRAPDSGAGAIYFGDNTKATIHRCVFQQCRVIAELTGNYSGGNGGNGGAKAGDGQVGGNGGHGGPAYYIPDKMIALGGSTATATGGTGGNGGGNGGAGGYGGYRNGIGGSGQPSRGTWHDTGIFPSNMYYMSYYWEDTANILNPANDPNDHLGFGFQWESEDIEYSRNELDYTDSADPNIVYGHYDRIGLATVYMVSSPFSPYYSIINEIQYSDPTITVSPDPNNPGKFLFETDYDNMVPVYKDVEIVTPLTPTDPNQPSTGACAGANYYGENSHITMTDTSVLNNHSFSNHGGGELYDKGCQATFDNCIYEGNTTINTLPNLETNYKFEGFGGGIFADQPVSMIFTGGCQFGQNNAYSGGAVYCNFGPSDPNSSFKLEFTDSVFIDNRADYHFNGSYGGAFYAGQLLDPYEEYFFNRLMNYRCQTAIAYYGALGSEPGMSEYATFITSIYADEHGNVPFRCLIGTALWNNELEADHILNNRWAPRYSVDVTGCTFTQNLAPLGAGSLINASQVKLLQSQFEANTGQTGAGANLYACDITAQNNIFLSNVGHEIKSQGYQSEIENGKVSTLGSGPALYISNSDSFIINNHFASNKTDGYGGALYINGISLSGYPQSVMNNLFVENVAGVAGGAFIADGGTDVEVMNCSFVDNTVLDGIGYGGAMVAHDGYASVTNTIFWNNLAALGTQLCVGDPLEQLQTFDLSYIPATTVYVNFSDIQGGQQDVYLDENGQPWLMYGQNNIEDDPATLLVNEADPQFISVVDANTPVERTFYLPETAAGQLLNSPCVDTGIPSYAFIYDPSEGGFVAITDVINWLGGKLGFDITTRTDHVKDAGTVNMGYHYDASGLVREYTLTAGIVVVDRSANGKLAVLTPSLTTPIPVGDPKTSTYQYTFKQGTVVRLSADPNEYHRVARWIGGDGPRYYYGEQNTVTLSGPRTVQVEFELAVARNLYVPESYTTIEEAILASRSNDTIILAPRQDEPYLITNGDGINFGVDEKGNPKELVIRSSDPNVSEIVKKTIIDCRGSRYISKRAFHFDGGQTSQSRIEGITIRNAFTAQIGLSKVLPTEMWPWPFIATPVPLPPYRALSGLDGNGDSYGGAILCEKNSSPYIYNCVFENCTVAGGIGGDGENGVWPSGLSTDADLDSQSGGHSGKGTGNGFGGAIAVLSGSSPRIIGCQFKENRATGGWGGIPGNAGTSYNSGRYGWGGNDPAGIQYAMPFGVNAQAGFGEGQGYGGAVYVASGCAPQIFDCQFEDNYARPGYVSKGGNEAGGNDYPEPWDADPWDNEGMRDGRDGQIISDLTSAGGAVFLEANADITLEGCIFNQNQAYEVSNPSESKTANRGGAICADPNAVLNIVPIANGKTVRNEFNENNAGAIYCDTNVKLMIQGTDFINNSSTLPVDSKIMVGVYTIDFQQATVVSNFPVAGAVTVARDANDVSIFTDCQFMNNTSHVGGGAVRTESDVRFTDCVLNSNKGASDGGAVYAYAQVPVPASHTVQTTFKNCELIGNDAQGFGGAVFTKHGILEIRDSFLVQNTAFSGGAVRASFSDFTMTDCVVYNNTVTGVVTGSHRTVTAEGFGGGLHLADTPFVIENTRFEENKAKGIIASGGALCITGSQIYYSQLLKNCLFADNESDMLGGAVSCLLDVKPTFENCTFAFNKGTEGSAVYVDHLSTAELKRSIVSGNKKSAGVYIKQGGLLLGKYCLFNGNEGGNISGASQCSAILPGNPMFAAGPLGAYYLNQASSPAVDPFKNDPGYPTAVQAGLQTFTTDPRQSNPLPDAAESKVDLGYHYSIPSLDGEKYDLTVVFSDGTNVTPQGIGTIMRTPNALQYDRGALVVLSAGLNEEYFLTGWSGGTFNDASQDTTNKVLMTRNKNIQALIRMRNTLYVGGSSRYDLLGDAIEAAQDGDIILVAPGEYTSASQFPSGVNTIILTGKKLTISGFSPADASVVRNTVFKEYNFFLSDLDSKTVIEGITLSQSRMTLRNSDVVLRNCVFSECRFHAGTPEHGSNPPAGTDGFHPLPIVGGALSIYDSSPAIQNCTFEDNWVMGADAENGFTGAQSHPTGGDGGFPGPAYGGAVYCAFSSEPNFVHCTFTGNQAIGGNGGNGAAGWVNNGVTWNGGRGGGWVYDPLTEERIKTLYNGGWDGWANNSNGHKYGFLSLYSEFYGEYDFDLWAKWFNWNTELVGSWEAFLAGYTNNLLVTLLTDPVGDPYDKMLDSWRYSGYGGAVYCEFDADAKFTDCEFSNNQTFGGLTGIGGPLPGDAESHWPDRQLDMPNAGGAVYAGWDSDLVFERCSFNSNTADTTTVALPHTLNISFGGAVAYENDCTANFTNCHLRDNNAAVGGGVYGYDAASTISDCNVVENEAFLGAGMYLEQERAVVSRTEFRKNFARGSQQNADPLNPEYTGMGAGFFAHLINLSVRDSAFSQNFAQVSGGGLMLSGTQEEQSDIFNCLFVENRAYRDGGGASLNWLSRAKFRNCTFGDNTALPFLNEFVGSGGGLYLATGSDAKVSDSIFWGNQATEGTQIMIGSGFEFDPRPSSLTISDSDVATWPSANAIYKGAGCTFNPPVNIFSANPEFVEPENTPAEDVISTYYLDQLLSPCKDKGSQSASEAGLAGYTTSLTAARDKGIVDLGYHYFTSARTQCGDIDEALLLSGQIDLEDLLFFVDAWTLSVTGNCTADNGWCSGYDRNMDGYVDADLNYDGTVDLEDMLAVNVCWLEEDELSPYPNPVKWVVEPNATTGKFAVIDMEAEKVHDEWWPDSYIQYYFDCVQPDGEKYDSGWISTPYWVSSDKIDPDTGEALVLSPIAYSYKVIARDGKGNITNDSEVKTVTPGESFILPTPVWKVLPIVTTSNQIRMELSTYEEISGGAVPAGYKVAYSFDELGGSRRGFTLNPAWVDPAIGYLANQTYTYTGKMQLYFGDPENGGTAIGQPTSVSASVVFVMADLNAPTPNPAQHTAGSPVRVKIGAWYHIVTAVTAQDIDAAGEAGEDNVNVEYKFICVENGAYSSGGSGDMYGIEWRNTQNVLAATTPQGLAQKPEEYWVEVPNVNYTWKIVVRDHLGNMTATSIGKLTQ